MILLIKTIGVPVTVPADEHLRWESTKDEFFPLKASDLVEWLVIVERVDSTHRARC